MLLHFGAVDQAATVYINGTEVCTHGGGYTPFSADITANLHNGLLDQGYYSDGLYTAPSDEAMIFDIQTAKDMGFNMLRKHIKIEPLRWYYHCDRIGMLVWQDMVNGGSDYRAMTIISPLITGIHFKDYHYKWFAREDAEGCRRYYIELDEMIRHLYNAVSIAMWVPFNEGWG